MKKYRLLFIIGLLLGFTLSFVYAFTTYYTSSSEYGIMYNRNGTPATTDSIVWQGDSLNIHADINVYGHDIDSIATARMRSLTLDTILLDTASVWFGNQVVYVGAKDNLDSIINNYNGTKLILNLVEDTVYHVNKINLQATDTVLFISNRSKYVNIDTIEGDWGLLAFQNIALLNSNMIIFLNPQDTLGEKVLFFDSSEFASITLTDTITDTLLRNKTSIGIYKTGNDDFTELSNEFENTSILASIKYLWCYNLYSSTMQIFTDSLYNNILDVWIYNSNIESGYIGYVKRDVYIYNSYINAEILTYNSDTTAKLYCDNSTLDEFTITKFGHYKQIYFNNSILNTFFIGAPPFLFGKMVVDSFKFINSTLLNVSGLVSIGEDTISVSIIQNSILEDFWQSEMVYDSLIVYNSFFDCGVSFATSFSLFKNVQMNSFNLTTSKTIMENIYTSNATFAAQDSLDSIFVYNSVFKGNSSSAGLNGIVNIDKGIFYFNNCSFLQYDYSNSDIVLVDISDRTGTSRPIAYFNNCNFKTTSPKMAIDNYGGSAVHLSNCQFDNCGIYNHGAYCTVINTDFRNGFVRGAPYWWDRSWSIERVYDIRDTFQIKIENCSFTTQGGGVRQASISGYLGHRYLIKDCDFVYERTSPNSTGDIVFVNLHRDTSQLYPNDSTSFIKFENCSFKAQQLYTDLEDSAYVDTAFGGGIPEPYMIRIFRWGSDSTGTCLSDSFITLGKKDTLIIINSEFVANDSSRVIYPIYISQDYTGYNWVDVILRGNKYKGVAVPAENYNSNWSSIRIDSVTQVFQENVRVFGKFIADTIQTDNFLTSYLELDSLKANNKIITNNIYSLDPSSNYLYINAYRTYINNGALNVVDTTYTNTLTLWEKSNGFNSIYRVKENDNGASILPSDKGELLLNDYMYTKLNDGGTYSWYDRTYYDRIYYRGIDTAIVGDTDTVPTGYYDRWFYQNIKEDNSQYPQVVMSFDTLGVVQIGKGLNLSYLSVSSIKSSYNLLHSQKFIFMDQYGVLWNKWYGLILPNELIKIFTSGTWGKDNTDIIFIPNWGTWGDNLTIRDFSFNLVSILYTLNQRGIYGSVLPFDSDSDTIYIDMTNDTINLSYDGIYRGLTFYTWLNNDNISDTSTIFYMQSDTVSATQTIMKLYQKADSVCFYITNDGITKDTIKFGNIPSQVWYFVYVIVDSIPLTDSIKVNLGIIRPPTTFGGRVTIDRVIKYLTIPDTLKYETVFFGGGWKGYLGAFGLVRSPYLYAVPNCGINGLQRWLW